MKNRLLTACAWLALLPLAPGQDGRPTSPELEEAIVVEELEHDLVGAAQRYEVLAQDQEADAAVQRVALLRLGRVRARLGDAAGARAALQRAAEGDDAVAAEARALLADPGQDEERGRELRAQARAQLEAFRTELAGNPYWRPSAELDGRPRDLLWIGRPAVPEIVIAMEQAMSRRMNIDEPLLHAGSAVLWRIGGEEAHAYLADLAASEDVERRRVAARGLQSCHDLDPQMLALAQSLLADPDPEGVVPMLAIDGAPRSSSTGTTGGHSLRRLYDPAALVGVLDTGAAPARAHLLSFLPHAWSDLPHRPDERATMALLAPRLERALDDVDPEVGQAAVACLARLGVVSEDSRALLLRRLPGLPADFQVETGRRIASPIGSAELADEFREMLRALGPARAERPTRRDESVSRLGGLFVNAWGRAALPAVIDWVAAGYAFGDELRSFTRRVCLPADAVPICAALAESPGFHAVLDDWLTSIDAPAECWPDLLRAERALEARTPYVEGQDAPWWWNYLYVAMARTGHPEAASHLSEVLARNPVTSLYRSISWALLFLSARRDDAVVRQALREAMVLELAEGEDADRAADNRSVMFVELVRLGDRAAIELLPRAYDLGMGGGFAFSEDREGWRPDADFVGWLTPFRRVDGEVEAWHGFDPETLAAIWDELLAWPREERWNNTWYYVDEALRPDPVTHTSIGGRRLPMVYYVPPLLVEVFARHWAERAGRETGPIGSTEYGGVVSLLNLRRLGIVTDPAARAALEALSAACLESASNSLRKLALDLLPAELDAADRERVLARLADPVDHVVQRAVELVSLHSIPIDRERLRLVLTTESPFGRTQAITSLAPQVVGGAVELVTPLLRDPDPNVRVAACTYLGMQVRTESVPELLEALKDTSPLVREAAARALQDIRFYHDQRAHWERVFAGTALGPGGAAEKLLQQAAPENDKEVRLLAIRSLGLVGAPESLPFLIDWSRAEDAQIAAAAREAIARIHQAGG